MIHWKVNGNLETRNKKEYHRRSIINQGLYILNPLIEGQKYLFNERFSWNYGLVYSEY